MSFISVIIFASSTLTVSASMMCPESIPTVSIVPRCPSNAMEWKLAADRKKCDVLGKIQSCTEVENFMYHCVLNRDATMLLEVCAPMYYMSGYCARFSEVHKRIINDPGLDCTQFEPPCPGRFQSYESYKYQMCYSNRTKQLTPAPAFHHLEPRQTYQQEKDEATAAIVNAFLVIFVIIIISLIILMSVGYKRKWIEFTCGKKRPKVYEENEEENERSIGEKIRDAGDCLNENRSQENSTENRENWEEKRGLIDDKCVIVGQIDANKSKESETIHRESDRYRLENEKEKYEYFWQKHSVFSQWYPCTFMADGITYNCAQQYMMYKKADIMGDEDSAKAIMTLDDPNAIMKRGRRVKNFKQDIWESCCQEIVERGIMEKFSQNEDLKQQLLSTYPKTLVEASPNDKIWGIGLSQDDPKAWNKLTWNGKNLLGEILTTVRDRLRSGIENAGPNGNSSDSDL